MGPLAHRIARRAIVVLLLGAFGAATVGRHTETAADGTVAVSSDVLTFVRAGEDLVAGRDPYRDADGGTTAYVYPPFTALVFAPLALLPPLAVDIGWYILNVLLLFGVIVYGYHLFTGGAFGDLDWRSRWILVAAPVALALRYLVRNAQDANINVLLLFLIVAALYRMERTGNQAWASLIGLAAAVKLVPLVFTLYFLARKQWRALGFLLTAFALATLLPAAVIGIPGLAEDLQTFLAYSSSQLTPRGLEVENFSVWGTLGRLLADCKAFEYPDGVPVSVNIASLPLPLIRGAVAVINAGLAVLLFAGARAEAGTHRRSLVLAVLVMNLASVLTEDHHTVGFALAYLFFVLRWRSGESSGAEKALVVITGAASVAVSYDLMVPLVGKLAYMRLLAYGLPVLPVGLLLTWMAWRSAPTASGTS